MSDEAEITVVRPGEELDLAALDAFLRARLNDLPEAPLRVRQFPRGRANLTYLLQWGEHRLVLRRPPLGKAAPGAHDMGREYTILSKLWQGYPRAPRALLLCTSPEVIGGPFAVQEYRADGVVIFGSVPAAMANLPRFGERIAMALGEALADLHRVDAVQVGLGDAGRPEGFVERQLAGWRERWARVRADDCAATMERVAERLQRDMPRAGRAALLHNDFKLDNCQLLPADPYRIASVFDWDMATLGDPLVDVGITLAYWPLMAGTAGLNLPGREVFLAAYAARGGFDLARLSWYEAFAWWRNAVAVQQLYDRYRRGESRDDRLAASGAAVPRLAARAESVLAESGA